MEEDGYPEFDEETIDRIVVERAMMGSGEKKIENEEVEEENGGSRTISISSEAHNWRQTQGERYWEGLLEPLDFNLRQSLIRYGEFIQAFYDAYDGNPHSKYTGTSRYRKEDFFEGVGLRFNNNNRSKNGTAAADAEGVGYHVTRYIYGTASVDIPGADFFLRSLSREAWSRESNWIGYVAVSDDASTPALGRRDIVIVWRGTLRPLEWINNFHIGFAGIDVLLPAEKRGPHHWYDRLVSLGGDNRPEVEKGWLNIYTTENPKSPYTTRSARDQVLDELRSLLHMYQDDEISITVVGHSLGAALATINAYDIVENEVNVRASGNSGLVPVTAFLFGSPSVGDDDFKRRFEALPELRAMRVRNVLDIIDHFPGRLAGYQKVGIELLLDSRHSPYLKRSTSFGDLHNLEAYLHLLAGANGPNMPFKLQLPRDVALVNKYSDFLRDEFLIPGNWWQEHNKGLVQRSDGSWYLPDRPHHHVPKPEPFKNPSAKFGV